MKQHVLATCSTGGANPRKVVRLLRLDPRSEGIPRYKGIPISQGWCWVSERPVVVTGGSFVHFLVSTCQALPADLFGCRLTNWEVGKV